MARESQTTASEPRVVAAAERPGGQAGTAILELALVLPLLMLILLGAIDVGRVFYENITVANAARAGVAYGAQSPGAAVDLAGMEQAALNEAADLEDVTAAAETYCDCPGVGTVDCATGGCDGQLPDLHVKVTVEKTFNMLFPYPGVPNPVNLRQVAVMRAR